MVFGDLPAMAVELGVASTGHLPVQAGRLPLPEQGPLRTVHLCAVAQGHLSLGCEVPDPFGGVRHTVRERPRAMALMTGAPGQGAAAPACTLRLDMLDLERYVLRIIISPFTISVF